jgi:hypothetical protein
MNRVIDWAVPEMSKVADFLDAETIREKLTYLASNSTEGEINTDLSGFIDHDKREGRAFIQAFIDRVEG